MCTVTHIDILLHIQTTNDQHIFYKKKRVRFIFSIVSGIIFT